MVSQAVPENSQFYPTQNFGAVTILFRNKDVMHVIRTDMSVFVYNYNIIMLSLAIMKSTKVQNSQCNQCNAVYSREKLASDGRNAGRNDKTTTVTLAAHAW